ncbi:hypothetical protein JST56_06655 [Candidatus Dependentiae bacterium]|nr:hypothetical protein [Candidatus Dependentiae bacterium]
MKINNKFLQILGFIGISLVISNKSVQAFSWSSFFTSDKPKQPVNPIKKLEDQLVHDPKNPYINYSLGVALYKNKQFDEAKNNFERAVLYATNLGFKEQAHFNLATCLYKNALSIMPENWESPEQEVDVKILDQAASLVSNAIKEYNSTLEINEKNEKAITNKKEAEKLLRKILKKKKQQEQENSENNPDDNNQDKDQNNKDNKDQDKQNKDSDKKDKNGDKKDQKSGKDQSEKEDSQDQNSESNDKKDGTKDDQKKSSENKKDKEEKNKNNNNDTQDQNKSSEKDDKQQGEQDSKERKPEQGREKDSSQNHNQPEQNGEDDPGKNDQEENDKNNVNHDEQPKNNQKDKQQTPSQGTQPEDEKQETDTEYEEVAGSAAQEDGTEKRVFRAILDNLDTDESKLQKHMIMQKTKGQKPPVGNMQKPW